MHPKLIQFLETKGRRLAELKITGGEVLILNDYSNLSENQKKELDNIIIELKAIAWALDQDYNEIINYFKKLEEPYIKSQQIKKNKFVLRGEE